MERVAIEGMRMKFCMVHLLSLWKRSSLGVMPKSPPLMLVMKARALAVRPIGGVYARLNSASQAASGPWRQLMDGRSM